MKEDQNRIVWIDWAKAIAIWCVVLGHDLNLDTEVASFIYTFHMPLFFLCSGCLFCLNDSFDELVQKNIKRLLLPYLFYNFLWALSFVGSGCIKMYMGLDPQWNQRVGIHLFPLFLGYSQEQFCAPVWFLLSLFWCKILGYWIWKGKLGVKLSASFIWLALLLVKIFTTWSFPFALDTALFGGIWFVLGIWGRNYFYALKGWQTLLLVLLGFVIGLLVYLKKGGCAYVVCDVNGILGIVGTFFCLLSIVSVCKWLEQFQFGLIEEISKATLFIMCVHIAIVSMIALFVREQGLVMPMMIDFIVVLCLTMARKVIYRSSVCQKSLLRYCI